MSGPKQTSAEPQAQTPIHLTTFSSKKVPTREVMGLKMPDPKKRRIAEVKKSDAGGKTSKGESSAKSSTGLPDISGIHLPHEEEDDVPIYDDCDEIRRKINAHLRTFNVTQAQFCRDLYAQFKAPKCKGIQSKQLSDFRSAKGSNCGAKSSVYYAAYVYFEKLRIAQRKPMSQHRALIMDLNPGGIPRDVDDRTTCISSSILQYRLENGRTYHGYKDGKYNVPNDEQENERLDLQHALFLRTFDDNLGFAPPNDPDANVKHVLDVGTGTGIWALDYADEHPAAQIIGVDLSPIQPSFVPPNLRFIIDDIEEEWQYSSRFDYIHSRMMNSSVADWASYAAKIYDNLAPGGYAELHEIDIFVASDIPGHLS
ncbi:unnamed protein product [Fusarium langsethiae]|nr:unnamed protein product [Fusarium langsethiae]